MMSFRKECILSFDLVHRESESRMSSFVNDVYDLGKSNYAQHFIEDLLSDYDLGFSLDTTIVGGECFREVASNFLFSVEFRDIYNKFVNARKRQIIESVLCGEVYK